MKRILLIFTAAIGLCFANSAKAQTTETFLVPDPQTAEWSYIETNSSGQHVATYYHSVESMAGDGINGLLKIKIKEVSPSTPSDTLTSSGYFRFRDGEYMADISASFEEDALADAINQLAANGEYTEADVKKATKAVKDEMKISGEIRGVPQYPTVGKLPDYDFQFKIFIVNMKVLGRDRKIVGTEKVETEAGTYDCFVMEETITTKALLMKDVIKVKSWCAYGVGLVKEVNYDKNGKVTSTVILNSTNW